MNERMGVLYDMWINYNPNPVRADSVGDCSVRAVSKALNTDWETAFLKLAVKAYTLGDVISSDVVWGSVLRDNGFKRYILPNDCPDCYTVSDFCEEHPTGTYVLKMYEHVATVADGDLYDAWNSENQIVLYYWTKEEADESTEENTDEQKG